MSPVYFDHNATTPLDESVLQAMLPFFREHYGNASSRHEFGRAARQAVDDAREQVADAVGAHPSQVYFVSGGTEANNLLIKGVAARLKPSQVAVSAVEHPSVTVPVQELREHGWKVRRLAVDHAGRIDMDEAKSALREPTGLMSVMLANNETGVIQDVASLAELARSAGALVHTDAVQALGKMPVNFATLNVHAMTLSAHKIYGPKGMGALILDKRLDIKPQITGGGHEKGLRAGTENVPAIVGFGAACMLASDRLAQSSFNLEQMRGRMNQGLRTMGAILFGDGAERLPNTSYFALPGIEGETLVMALDRAGYAVASGSACSSGGADPSPVLLSMGVERELARCAVRVSLGRGNEMSQIERFLQALQDEIFRLKKLAAIAV
ncbi:MAG: cysteine desulfurase family protein [Sulfuricella sp.]|nr:cysteine desulfurase family protein [Sulfuricella sp.]